MNDKDLADARLRELATVCMNKHYDPIDRDVLIRSRLRDWGYLSTVADKQEEL